VKRRRAIRKAVKGYRQGRKNLLKAAKTAILKAGVYAYRDRKANKRNFRRLWAIRLNAALDPMGISYSKFIGALKKKNIVLDRKILADLALNNPKVFAAIVQATK
jgi:large subunit ribosomal protein L20